jgi:hypothetical protein
MLRGFKAVYVVLSLMDGLALITIGCLIPASALIRILRALSGLLLCISALGMLRERHRNNMPP